METCITLYKPFLLGIFQDICDLYPEEISSNYALGCQNIIKLLKPTDVMNLCKIGKSVEKSLITGERLHIEEFPTTFSSEGLSKIFYAEDGFPSLLHNCFERVFRLDGTPVFTDVINETTLIPREIQDEVELTSVTSIQGRLRQDLALAILCLRQFYVGCSKLSDWECLRRRVFGDQHFSSKGYKTSHADLQFGDIKYREEDTSFRYFGRRYRLLVTIC